MRKPSANTSERMQLNFKRLTIGSISVKILVPRLQKSKGALE